FRSISEAADEVGVPQHVLRFWEGKLDFIQPVKRAGGRRFYRPEDILILKDVRRLLHEEGMTIKGVERLFKDKSVRSGKVPATVTPLVKPETLSSGVNRSHLSRVLEQIEAAQARLNAVLA
ncbi:MerR family transcriptional regulator, partial [Brevundimonas sp.]